MRATRIVVAVSFATLLTGSATLVGQSTRDVIRVGDVTVNGGTQSGVMVPVYITDNSGTLLNNANTAHSRVAGFILKVQYGNPPGTASTCVTQDFSGGNDPTVPPFVKNGVLASLTPNKFYSVAGTDLTGTTGATDATIVFTRNDNNATTPAIPGFAANTEVYIGDLIYDLSSCPNGVINLHIVAAAGTDESSLTNDAPQTATPPGVLLQEKNSNGTGTDGLVTTDGTITVQQAGPTNTPTNTPGAGATSTPTNTPAAPTSTPTNTPQGPTSTPTNTPSGPTSTPTNTPQGPTSTPTNTPQAPTATPTTPQATSTPTRTPTTAPTSTPTPSGQPFIAAIPTLDHRALAALAVLLAAVGLMLTKRMIK